jgi:hypothetical protein
LELVDFSEDKKMESLQIVFGVVTSIGAIAGIYFHIRNKNRKDVKNQINITASSIGTQTIQQAEQIINNNKILKDKTQEIPSNRIDLKSDAEIRNFIKNEMERLSLIEANFDQLAEKFIDASIDWSIAIDKIEKGLRGNYSVYFASDKYYSRLEYFIVNLDKFPILKFAKRGDKYKIEAQIKEFGESVLVLDRVIKLEKLKN